MPPPATSPGSDALDLARRSPSRARRRATSRCAPTHGSRAIGETAPLSIAIDANGVAPRGAIRTRAGIARVACAGARPGDRGVVAHAGEQRALRRDQHGVADARASAAGTASTTASASSVSAPVATRSRRRCAPRSASTATPVRTATRPRERGERGARAARRANPRPRRARRSQRSRNAARLASRSSTRRALGEPRLEDSPRRRCARSRAFRSRRASGRRAAPRARAPPASRCAR